MTAFLSGLIVMCPVCGQKLGEQVGLHHEANKITSMYSCDPCDHRPVDHDFSARSDAHRERPADEELSGARRYLV